MLRILQIIVGLSIVPMMCLGLMASLSGGGLTPAFQQIGGQLTSLSPLVGLLSVGASWLLQRAGLVKLAYAVLALPLVVWSILIARLQLETSFFSV